MDHAGLSTIGQYLVPLSLGAHGGQHFPTLLKLDMAV